MRRLLILFFLCPLLFNAQEEDKPHKETAADKTLQIEQIFRADSIQILASSRGCFNSEDLTYTFIKVRKNFVVTCQSRRLKTKEPLSCSCIAKMKASKWKQLEKLMQHGAAVDRGMCTTRIKFTLSSAEASVTFMDNRCSDEDDILRQLNQLLKLSYKN